MQHEIEDSDETKQLRGMIHAIEDCFVRGNFDATNATTLIREVVAFVRQTPVGYSDSNHSRININSLDSSAFDEPLIAGALRVDLYSPAECKDRLTPILCEEFAPVIDLNLAGMFHSPLQLISHAISRAGDQQRVYRRAVELVRFLCNSPALDVSFIANNGLNAIHSFCTRYPKTFSQLWADAVVEILDILLSHPTADISFPTQHTNRTPLHCILHLFSYRLSGDFVQFGLRVVKLLLDHGASLHAVSEHGTPLLIAAQSTLASQDLLPIFQYLLERATAEDLNFTDPSSGETVLHACTRIAAVEHSPNRLYTVQALLDLGLPRGLDLTVTNSDNETAFDMAALLVADETVPPNADLFSVPERKDTSLGEATLQQLSEHGITPTSPLSNEDYQRQLLLVARRCLSRFAEYCSGVRSELDRWLVPDVASIVLEYLGTRNAIKFSTSPQTSV